MDEVSVDLMTMHAVPTPTFESLGMQENLRKLCRCGLRMGCREKEEKQARGSPIIQLQAESTTEGPA